MKGNGAQKGPKTHRLPGWLRILLMILVVLGVCVAFYFNTRKYLEHLGP